MAIVVTCRDCKVAYEPTTRDVVRGEWKRCPAWLAGAAPPDRYTDLSLGGRE